MLLKKWKTIILDLPSFGSFNRAVPEENFFKISQPEKILLIGQSQTRTAYRGQISCTIGTKYGNFAQDLLFIIPTNSRVDDD